MRRFYIWMFTMQALFFNFKVWAAPTLGRLEASAVMLYANGFVASFGYDSKGVIPLDKWTAGGGITFIPGGFAVYGRGLYWPKKFFSGFYFGPKILMGIAESEYGTYSYRGQYSQLLMGAGGEAGWLFRLPKRFDVGGGVETLFTNHGIGLGVKLSAGYLLR